MKNELQNLLALAMQAVLDFGLLLFCISVVAWSARRRLETKEHTTNQRENILSAHNL